MEVSLFPFGLFSDDLSFSCVTLYNSLYKINVCMQMLKKLSKQLGEDDWNWNNLNTLCWAIGSISGSMGEEQVGTRDIPYFANLYLRSLLNFCTNSSLDITFRKNTY